jgi:hypothetical protein
MIITLIIEIAMRIIATGFLKLSAELFTVEEEKSSIRSCFEPEKSVFNYLTTLPPGSP